MFLRLKSSRHNRLVYNDFCIFYYQKLLLNLIQNCTRHFKMLTFVQYTSPWLDTKNYNCNHASMQTQNIFVVNQSRHFLLKKIDCLCRADQRHMRKSLTSRKRTVFSRGHEFKTVVFVQNVASGSWKVSLHYVSSLCLFAVTWFLQRRRWVFDSLPTFGSLFLIWSRSENEH